MKKKLGIFAVSAAMLLGVVCWGNNKRFEEELMPKATIGMSSDNDESHLFEFRTEPNIQYITDDLGCTPTEPTSTLSINIKHFVPTTILNAVVGLGEIKDKIFRPNEEQRSSDYSTLFHINDLDPDRRSKLANLASQYDIVAMQEVFWNPKAIQTEAGHKWASWPYFGESHPILGAAITPFGTPGLLMLSNIRPDSITAVPYEVCSSNNGDCIPEKGLQIERFGKLTIAHTHMDSSKLQEDIDARTAQVDMIIEKLKNETGPLVIIGDLNLKTAPTKEDLEGTSPENRAWMIERSRQDMVNLHRLIEALDLTLIIHDRLDVLAVRGVTALEAKVLPIKGSLTDHNAISAIIQVNKEFLTEKDYTCSKERSSAMSR